MTAGQTAAVAEGEPAGWVEPPAWLREAGLQAVLAALPGARVVGGAVRDSLAGRAVHDVDLATPYPPERVMAALAAAGLKHVPTGLQHGTVTAISGGRGFEVTTLRTDERTDGRHAEVAWTTDWQQDAARRDFTINAMSMRPDGAVFDYFGGRADLAQGRVRFVGDPVQRIAEDYLRVLRFFRFHARYAAGPPDPVTEAALRQGAAGLDRLSVERVWTELKRILETPEPVAALRLMERLGVLAAVLPGHAPLDRIAWLVDSGAPPDPLLRLVTLDPDPGLAARLKLSRAEAMTLEAYAGVAPDPAWSDNSLRRALADVPAEVLVGRAWLAGGAGPGWAGLRARIAAMPRPVFPLHGRDAMQLGMPAGPAVGVLLAAVRAWWMAGGCRASAAECRAELARRAAAC